MIKYKSLILPLLMMLITVPILIKLGLWQLERKADKEALVTRIEQRAGAVPHVVTVQELIDSKETLDALDYTPVTLKGSFVAGYDAQVFTNIDEPSVKFNGPGYDILSLFVSSEGGYVLVNRGFVPPEKRNSVATTSEPIIITGLIRKPERRSYVDVADRPERKEFAIREPKAIIAGLGIVDFKPIIDKFYIDLRTPVPTGGLPQPYKTQINITNNHLQYVVTWWGFALVFTVMFGVVLVRRFKTL